MHNPVSNTPLLQSTPNFVHGDVDQAAFYQHLQQPVSIYGPPSVKGEVLQGPIQTVQKSEKISRNSKKMQKYEKVGIATQYIIVIYDNLKKYIQHI